MYALYSKPNVFMNVTWPRCRTAEDVTRALAREKGLPLEWNVSVNRKCGGISIDVVNAKGRLVSVRRGESVDFYADGRDGYYEAPDSHDMVTVHEDRVKGRIYDARVLGDLRDLADRGHRVMVKADHVIVDRTVYSTYILRDEGGRLSSLPYDDPHDYAVAMGLREEMVPMDE